ncbi:hypothetical protein Taro_052744 [Colocasia esculenta]|uniref:Uncharacterized protein n=1 Tax=Colocasia esculenta TaxID=4460 RepID=A0A843XKL3_COLES|nr:hypothetical protein [Colocasia esculenta]
MAAPQPPAATAATMSTLLPLPLLKSLRPFSVPELSSSKKPALVTGISNTRLIGMTWCSSKKKG